MNTELQYCTFCVDTRFFDNGHCRRCNSSFEEVGAYIQSNSSTNPEKLIPHGQNIEKGLVDQTPRDRSSDHTRVNICGGSCDDPLFHIQ